MKDTIDADSEENEGGGGGQLSLIATLNWMCCTQYATVIRRLGPPTPCSLLFSPSPSAEDPPPRRQHPILTLKQAEVFLVGEERKQRLCFTALLTSGVDQAVSVRLPARSERHVGSQFSE